MAGQMTTGFIDEAFPDGFAGAGLDDDRVAALAVPLPWHVTMPGPVGNDGSAVRPTWSAARRSPGPNGCW